MSKTSPIWKDEVEGMIAEAYYRPDTHEFEVTVHNEKVGATTTVPAMYVPQWGIDVADMHAIMDAAEDLAKELEDGA